MGKIIALLVLLGGASYYYFGYLPYTVKSWYKQKEGFDEAIKESKDTSKAVLILFSSKRCPPCRYLAKEFTGKKDVQKFIKKHFHPVLIDADKLTIPDAMWLNKHKFRMLPTFAVFKAGSPDIYEKIVLETLDEKDIKNKLLNGLKKVETSSNSNKTISKKEIISSIESKKDTLTSSAAVSTAADIKKEEPKKIIDEKVKKIEEQINREIKLDEIRKNIIDIDKGNNDSDVRLVAYLSPHKKSVKFIDLGNDNTREKNYPKCMDNFKKALKYDKNHFEIWYGLGYCQMMYGLKSLNSDKTLFKEAIDSFKKVLTENKSHLKAKGFLEQLEKIILIYDK